MQQIFILLSCRLFTAQHVSGVFPPIVSSSMTAVAASGFLTYRGDSRVVFVVGPYDYHHDTKVKPEADTAVIELLTMAWKTPKTC
jgi:hypothetical protein